MLEKLTQGVSFTGSLQAVFHMEALVQLLSAILLAKERKLAQKALVKYW